MKPSILLLLGSMLWLTGCQHRYEEVSLNQNRRRPDLKQDATVYVAIPPDGSFKDSIAVDSGRLTAEKTCDAFAKYVKRAYVGRRVESLPESLATARQYRITYLVYPSIRRWEDRATEYSGRTDKLEVRFDVLDVASGETLDSTLIRGRSRWMTDGGDTPGDLLEEPITQYVASLFRVVHEPSGLP